MSHWLFLVPVLLISWACNERDEQALEVAAGDVTRAVALLDSVVVELSQDTTLHRSALQVSEARQLIYQAADSVAVVLKHPLAIKESCYTRCNHECAANLVKACQAACLLHCEPHCCGDPVCCGKQAP